MRISVRYTLYKAVQPLRREAYPVVTGVNTHARRIKAYQALTHEEDLVRTFADNLSTIHALWFRSGIRIPLHPGSFRS